MEEQSATTLARRRNPLATASLVLSFVGWVLFVLLRLVFPEGSSAMLCPFLCWGVSLVSGIVALVPVGSSWGALKGKIQATIGICVSAIPFIIIMLGFIFLIFVVFRAEPYDESHPASVIATIEDNCGFKFPENVECLKAADKIDAGIDRPYIFIVRFTTDQNGFAQLRDSLSQLGDWKEIAEGRDPREVLWPKDTPEWYRAKVERGRTYASFLVSKNNKMRLSTICVELMGPGGVAVYMEGWGDSSLKENRH